MWKGLNTNVVAMFWRSRTHATRRCSPRTEEQDFFPLGRYITIARVSAIKGGDAAGNETSRNFARSTVQSTMAVACIVGAAGTFHRPINDGGGVQGSCVPDPAVESGLGGQIACSTVQSTMAVACVACSFLEPG